MPEAAVLQDAPPTVYGNSRLGGINSGQTRRANAVKLRQLSELIPSILPSIKATLEVAQAQDTQVSARLAMIETHMKAIDDLMLQPGLKPSDWRDLSMARERLFNQWAHLAGIPKPMAAREVRTTRRVIQAPAAPIELPPVG